MRNKYWVIIILLSIISPSLAQITIKIDPNQINQIVAELKDSLNIPGIAVGIAIGDQIKYTNVFGYANIETKTELDMNSVWHLCSVSKQFTTVACLKLVEENKLSLKDKISMYLDKLPEAYLNITISELLSQSSGIKDYLNEYNLYGSPWEEVRKQIFADTLNFKPGTAWSYSNTGFWTVAKIIEKITGMDYNQYLSQNFFDKINMEYTQRISGEKVIKSRVKGYVYRDGIFYNSIEDINNFRGKGDGDMMSTLNDLLKWNIALTHGRIIRKEFLSELWTPTKLIDGRNLEITPNSEINYGMGWFIRNVDGEKVVWTPGAGFGFSTTSQYFPEHNLTIIVFCNKQQFQMADEIGVIIAGKILY